MRLSGWPWAVGLLSLVAACSYAPNIPSGTVVCGTADKGCPVGYECADDGACWKDGTSPSAADILNKFVGTWTFDSGTRDAICGGTVTPTTDLMNDFLMVTKNDTELVANYYCPWMLHRTTGTSTASLIPDQQCDEDVQGTTYHWAGTAFSFTTVDGKTASLSGHMLGSCDATFSGQLSKNP
jgi:hypothetical protein